MIYDILSLGDRTPSLLKASPKGEGFQPSPSETLRLDHLGVVLPEQVPVRVEGAYKEDGEPFVAKLAVTVDGIHSARRFRSAGTKEQVEKKLHKVDIRLKPKALKLKSKRYCTKRVATVAANDP